MWLKRKDKLRLSGGTDSQEQLPEHAFKYLATNLEHKGGN